MELIIPMAGKSSRFPDVKPKWMLTHPSGNFMVLEAIKGLDLNLFQKIHFVFLAEHEAKYSFLRGFKEELQDMELMDKANFISLNEPTVDQPETVLKAIELGGIEGSIVIKDSDNYFSADVSGENFVCYTNLNDCGLIKPKNKSYISIDNYSNVTNIVEKQIISPTFCVGAYGFKDAAEYVSVLNELDSSKERYISNVIYQMVLNGSNFEAVNTRYYNDWGTIEDWDRFKRTFATLFVDLDGTIVKNSSAHFPPYVGESEPIEDNLEIIKTIQKSGKFEVIITTSRPEKYRDVTIKQLKSLGLEYKILIMGLQHSRRIIINDYSKSNPYKSCDAVNLKRDSNDLREILRESLGIDYEEI